jgi:catechol 2,3-dioxygenase-like lactoylglutathione lyase family enzyme
VSHSTVRHVRLTTRNLRSMVSWYARVFGMSSGHSSTPGGMRTASRLIVAWSSNDPANPCVTLLSVSGRPIEARHIPEPQHVTLLCATLNDLRGAHERLKNLGIEPIQTMERGTATTFVYEDPDRNCVELKLDVATQFQS